MDGQIVYCITLLFGITFCPSVVYAAWAAYLVGTASILSYPVGFIIIENAGAPGPGGAEVIEMQRELTPGAPGRAPTCAPLPFALWQMWPCTACDACRVHFWDTAVALQFVPYRSCCQ